MARSGNSDMDSLSGDSKVENYEEEYKNRKERLREMHKRLKSSKRTQEIYHKIMGFSEGSTDDSDSEETENS